MLENRLDRKELWYTVGPSSLGKEKEMFANGATGVRLTFSYGTPEIQLQRATALKYAADQIGVRCCFVADLAGEKFRIGTFQMEAQSIAVSAGMPIRIVLAESSSPSLQDLIIPVPNSSFFSQLKKGSRVIIGDGSAVFDVTTVHSDQALGEIIDDGMVNSYRGLSIQSAEFRPRSLTAKDLNDLQHIVSSSVYNIVALSFVGSDDDIHKVREIIKKANSKILILAKIETLAGLENVDAICQAADFVMAARGDLALTMPWIELPAAVEHIASACETNSKQWILATQIAEGVERFAIPTRAEICDLAHWLKTGCAGVMLSYETAFGSHPVNALACTAMLLSRWG